MKDSDALVASTIEAFKRGQIVVVMDDTDRENEADLFVAASKCTKEQMAFFIRHTSGIVCAPLEAMRASELQLAPMVAENAAPLGTAFTVSVDARAGLTTGISAEERTRTVRLLADQSSVASNFVRPGHVFPLIAREGGVLIRSGHTEACVDLCRLASLPTVGVLSELMDDDGAVMRGDRALEFSQKHHFSVISIADLIAYRQSREKLVERVSTFEVASEIGPLLGHAYLTPFDKVHHLAFVYGDVSDGGDILVRLHRGSVIHDVFGRPGPIQSALKRFKQAGRGVLIYLRDGVAGVPLQQPPGRESGSDLVRVRKWRDVGLGAQILRDLNVSLIRLLSSSRHNYVGLEGFGIQIVSTEGLD
ncbi:MAG: 3,4-dihydroxy-2-butanone-4-phosphate synthase [Acidobacteriota bacterium]